MEKQDQEIVLRVVRVHSDLVLCGITDETLALGERDIGGCRPVTLVVGDDLDTVVLPDTDTANKLEYMQDLRRGAQLTSRSSQDRYRWLLSL